MNLSYTRQPGCEVDTMVGERLEHPSPFAQASLMFFIVINIITFPFTAALNALVMIAVKTKSRLRVHKSNILLAMLASTDFIAAILAQPTFIAIAIMLLRGKPDVYCLLLVFRIVLTGLFLATHSHLVLIAGERYLAILHPFLHISYVTVPRLLAASILAWLFSVISLILYILVEKNIFFAIIFSLFVLSVVFNAICHVKVYREIRRSEQQIAAQQVTQEASQQLLRDKKALKLTSMILAALLFCFIFPFALTAVVRYGFDATVETRHILVCFGISIALLNSLLNPIIYSVRMRQFRVAFIELIYGTVNINEAEEIESRFFGARVRVEGGQERGEQVQQKLELEVVQNKESPNKDVILQQRNHAMDTKQFVRLPGTLHRHSI